MGVRYMSRTERAAFQEMNPHLWPDICDEIGPNGYGCTREPGHSGHKHIARGPGDAEASVYEVWYDKGWEP
jgi:hypothetical protein